MIRNFFWDFLGRFGNWVVTFFVSIILTRLLSPVEYGIMGMAMVIIGVAAVFVDMGFYRAIVQKQDVTRLQLSTIFYINLLFAALLTALCFALAAPLARFYGQPLIMPIFRTLSFTFVLNAIYLVPSALMHKEMQFRSISVFNLLAAVLSGVVGIVMAYGGYGVWSLVGQTLSASLLLLLLYFGYYRWLPALAFSLSAIKPLWSYGSRMFATSFLELSFARIDSFIIGKLFPVAILGYYSRAQALEGIVRQLSVASFMSVLFPVIAKNQHDRIFLTELYKKYLHLICFIAFGLAGLLFVGARYLFIILYTEKWAYSGLLFQLMAAGLFIYPLNSLMSNIITGVGNSKGYLRLELIKKATIVPVYAFGFFWGLEGFVLLLVGAGFINLVITHYFVRKEVFFDSTRHMTVIGSYGLVALVAASIAYILFLPFPVSSPYLSLVLYCTAFAVSYLLLSHLARLQGERTIFNNLAAKWAAHGKRTAKNVVVKEDGQAV